MKHRIMEHIRIIVLDHANTGSGRTNNITVVLKFTNEFFSHFFAIVPIPRVKGRLSATGLLRVIIYTTAHFFKDLHHIETGIRIDLVNKAGDEYIYYHNFFRLSTKY